MAVVDEDALSCTSVPNAVPPPPTNGAQIRTFNGFTSVDVIRVVAGATSAPTSVACPGATIQVFPGAGTSVQLTPGNTCQLTATFNNPIGTITVTGVVSASATSNTSFLNGSVDFGVPLPVDTQQVIARFVQNRITNLLNNQPNITGLIDGSFSAGGGAFGNFSLRPDEAGFTMAFAGSLGRVWAEARRNRVRTLSDKVQRRDKHLPTGIGHTLPDRNVVASFTPVRLPPGANAGASPLAGRDTPAREEPNVSPAGLNTADSLTPAQKRGYDVWTQVHGAHSDAGSSDSTLWVGYLGAHAFVTPNVLVGGLVQLDWADETNDTAGSSADGFGWMVGPYIAAKLPDQNLFFDARATWGRSDNDVSPIGTYTDGFDTERWMISGKLSGLYQTYGLNIRPAVSVSYFEETQESYTDSLGFAISSQTFSQGEVRFGPTFSHDISRDDGTVIRPKFGVSGVWNFHVNNGVNSQGAVLGTGDVRARLDAGVTVITIDTWSLDFGGYYDGLGAEDYHSFGGTAQVSVPLN